MKNPLQQEEAKSLLGSGICKEIRKEKKKSSQFLSMTKASTTSDNGPHNYSPISLLVCWKNLLLLMAEHQVLSDPQLFSITKHTETC